MAFAGLSEYTFFKFSRIREPFIRKTLNKRALMAAAIIILVDAVLVLIYVLVPGKRL